MRVLVAVLLLLLAGCASTDPEEPTGDAEAEDQPTDQGESNEPTPEEPQDRTQQPAPAPVVPEPTSLEFQDCHSVRILFLIDQDVANGLVPQPFRADASIYAGQVGDVAAVAQVEHAQCTMVLDGTEEAVAMEISLLRARTPSGWDDEAVSYLVDFRTNSQALADVLITNGINARVEAFNDRSAWGVGWVGNHATTFGGQTIVAPVGNTPVVGASDQEWSFYQRNGDVIGRWDQSVVAAEGEIVEAVATLEDHWGLPATVNLYMSVFQVDERRDQQAFALLDLDGNQVNSGSKPAN